MSLQLICFVDSSAAKTTNARDLIGEEDKYSAFTASLGMAPQVLGNYTK